jgi:hypothetical protein
MIPVLLKRDALGQGKVSSSTERLEESTAFPLSLEYQGAHCGYRGCDKCVGWSAKCVISLGPVGWLLVERKWNGDLEHMKSRCGGRNAEETRNEACAIWTKVKAHFCFRYLEHAAILSSNSDSVIDYLSFYQEVLL